MNKINTTENILFDRFAASVEAADVPLIFVLGSPRTGSTLVYQILVNYFNFFYFSNFIADNFPEHPSVGAALDQVMNPRSFIDYESKFGKTEGVWGPSEASAVFRNWFGGEHPAQTKSCNILPGQELHFLKSMKSIYALTGRPILSKNAWNCFRIAAIMRLFPQAHFVWVRRDIGESAVSDLAARYRRGGATVWNSATTSNYLEIQKLPYWQQVVEQQFEYNKSVEADLQQFSHGQFIEIWYEEICGDIERQLSRLESHFSAQHLPLVMTGVSYPQPIQRSDGVKTSLRDDYSKIMHYVNEQKERLHSYIFNL